jgi:hypothetical protein
LPDDPHEKEIISQVDDESHCTNINGAMNSYSAKNGDAIFLKD